MIPGAKYDEGLPVGIDDVREAARRIASEAVRTPLLVSPVLDRRMQAHVLLKAENLQRTGSFKFRGAFNRISRITAAEARAVVAYSSGNHAQGVAAAARIAGLAAVIVMPRDAPAAKIERTRADGAEVVLIDREREDRVAVARTIAEERDAVIVPPFDDPLIIAGQGTAGLEIAEEAEAHGRRLDVLLVPCSGGGLIAGIAVAMHALSPEIGIHAVEPEGFDDHRRSLASGRRERNARAAGSICDALLAAAPGEITFEINRRLLAGALTVSDEEVKAAMRYAFSELKLVLEPSGAAALAALLAGRIEARGRTLGVVLSGANVDAALYAQIVAGGEGA